MTFTTSWSQKKSDGAVTRRADVLKSRQVTWKCPLNIDNFKAKIISLGTYHSKSFFQIARCFGKYFTFAHKIFWPYWQNLCSIFLKKRVFEAPQNCRSLVPSLPCHFWVLAVGTIGLFPSKKCHPQKLVALLRRFSQLKFINNCLHVRKLNSGYQDVKQFISWERNCNSKNLFSKIVSYIRVLYSVFQQWE